MDGLNGLLLPPESRPVASVQKEGFECDVCSKKHMLIHAEAKYSCSICDKKFTYKWNMQSHMITHSGEKPHKCDQCDSAFFRLGDLRKHASIHTIREKTFKCQYCDVAFHKKSYLKTHEQRHLGDKRFQCSFCPKRFILKTDRNSHERTHTGEKPFQCALCNARFGSSSNLRRHEKGYCMMNPDRKHPGKKGTMKMTRSPTRPESDEGVPALLECNNVEEMPTLIKLENVNDEDV